MIKIIRLIGLLVFTGTTLLLAEQKFSKVENLKGYWKFKIGDNKMWANPNFNDNDWDKIKVPARWEEEGYNGYDGYAWYRKDFELNPKYKIKNLYLSLGVIDDVAEIYINGKLIGTSGSFPPNYVSAYNFKVWVPVPKNILNWSMTNIIAVRVYDSEQAGGIYKGDIGFYSLESSIDLLADLTGIWKFKLGDNITWSHTDYNDNKWKQIIVPSYWDGQGYNDYDGFAWYRYTFDLTPDEFYDQELVLLLGKIDDLDETYLNNKFIGSTGDMIISPIDGSINGKDNKEFNQFRAYKISKKDLNNGKNVIAVRVYDGIYNGGIYEGPIGIATLRNYVNFRINKSDRKNKSFFDTLFDD